MSRPLWIALAIVTVFAIPASAQAAVTWSTTKTPVDTTNGLGAIACPAANLCVAGGPEDRISTSTDPTGGAWSTISVPVSETAGAIADVSCPNVSLCVAVDDSGNVLSSTNPGGGAGSWHAEHFKRPSSANSIQFTSVSCPTITRCVAVDFSDNGLLSTSNPAAGQTGWTLDSITYTPRQVSCTVVVCVAVNGAYIFTTREPGTGGSAWTRTTIAGEENFDGEGRPTSISCTARICVAGGYGGINGVEAFSSTDPDGGAASWKHVRLTGSNFEDTNCVDGPVSTLCTLSTNFGGFVLDSANPGGEASDWAVSPYVAAPQAGPIDKIADVGCPTITLCIAVTSSGSAIVGTASGSTLPDPAKSTDTTPAPSGGDLLPDAPGPFQGVHFPSGTTTISHTSNAVSFLLESSAGATGTLAGTTANSYVFERPAFARAAPRRISLGKVKFSLSPNKPKRVSLALPKKVQSLLKAHGSVPALFTITSTDAAGEKKVVSRRYTLKAAKRAAKRRR
jgi:hypothetical protein